MQILSGKQPVWFYCFFPKTLWWCDAYRTVDMKYMIIWRNVDYEQANGNQHNLLKTPLFSDIKTLISLCSNCVQQAFWIKSKWFKVMNVRNNRKTVCFTSILHILATRKNNIVILLLLHQAAYSVEIREHLFIFESYMWYCGLFRC